jgi:hypothetical protein
VKLTVSNKLLFFKITATKVKAHVLQSQNSAASGATVAYHAASTREACTRISIGKLACKRVNVAALFCQQSVVHMFCSLMLHLVIMMLRPL